MSAQRPVITDDVPANVAAAWKFAAALDPEYRTYTPWDPNDPEDVSYAEYLRSPELQDSEWRFCLWRHYRRIGRIAACGDAARAVAQRWAEWADTLARLAAEGPLQLHSYPVQQWDDDRASPAPVELAPSADTSVGLGRRLDRVLADADALAARLRRHAEALDAAVTRRLDELTAVFEEGPWEHSDASPIAGSAS